MTMLDTIGDHPLIGAMVKIKAGAVPSGFEPGEPWGGKTPTGLVMVRGYCAAEDGNPHGTVYADGWSWKPEDVSLA